MIRGQNAQIAHARPEWIPRGQGGALFEIGIVRQHASLGPPARPRRIHDASGVFALPGHELRIALTAKFFPAICAMQIHAGRRLCHQHDLGCQFRKFRRLGNRAPQVVFDNQEPRLGMRQQLQMLRRRQFVIQRHKYSAAEKD
jgi:hypothetical protein